MVRLYAARNERRFSLSWVKIDDHFTRHPKLLSVTHVARWAYLDGLCYCAQYLTDGFIAEGSVAGIASLKQRAELVGVELWHEVKGGINVHDYLEYNPTKAQVLAERERSKRRRTSERPENDHGKIRDIRETYGG